MTLYFGTDHQILMIFEKKIFNATLIDNTTPKHYKPHSNFDLCQKYDLKSCFLVLFRACQEPLLSNDFEADKIQNLLNFINMATFYYS